MTSTVAQPVKTLKVYVAGKISPDSVFGTHSWRDDFCEELSQKSGFYIINLDPTKTNDEFFLNENDSKLIFGRDCFMISQADLVIVYLTNDISVGGSQEMLIAKHYKKPLIGIAPKEGKFNRRSKEILGVFYKNWIHPFVNVPCDAVVETIDSAASFIQDFYSSSNRIVKSMSILDEALEYYKQNHYPLDRILHSD